MEFVKAASAGTMDSCDISIRLEKGTANKNVIYLTSAVQKQFGEHIERLIEDLLNEHGVTGVIVNAVDKGALDCTISARTICAIRRACKVEEAHNG
ncbi:MULTISPECIES: citrate lyase acyl carrier protein [unclassified Fusibacter]|uniref:citrate lyase acyl carrier protein n=1 Tax=unclassified Fusibacter TaxID=2624464 RepID=UPI001012A504|nr:MULTISPECIES: citrate lyase acyl carrier protein [unclassified Fusibacter]MCK8058595.1 citrate lyase acyl carrier protein [Fusibacter sp. A2]NPE22635.1 citrate lyase acyl carrier protein [Fusibacter sp. A1]RXV60199.1 citrate lyase acyl carrier protein [Fusibacter sp. A1]